MCIMKNVEIVLKKGEKGRKTGGRGQRNGESESNKGKKKKRQWLERIVSVDRGQCVCPQRHKRPSGSISV